MNVHEAIENLQEQLGYPVSPEGCCHGFALRWLEACFLNEDTIFAGRVSTITNQLDTLAETINKAQEKKVQERTEDDKQLLDILAFYNSMGVYQMPEMYPSLFGAYLHQCDVKKISNLIASEKILAQGGMEELIADICNIEEVKTYLQAVEQVMRKIHCSAEDKVGIVLASFDHTNAVVYQPGSGWKFMDINLYPSRSFPGGAILELTTAIHEGFALVSDTKHFAFHMSMFTVGLQQHKHELLKEHLDSFKTSFRKTRVISEPKYAISLAKIAAKHGDEALIKQIYTKTVLDIKTDDGFILPYFAAQNGHDNVIDVLGEFGINFDEANDNGATSVFIAAANNHGQVIKKLAYYGADLNASYQNQTALYIASYRHNTEVINALAEGGADFNLTPHKNIVPPIFIVIRKGYVDLIPYFILGGADLNLSCNQLTPLFLAVLSGQTEIVKELIQHKQVELEKEWIGSSEELYELTDLIKDDEADSRMSAFIEKQFNPSEIKVTAYDFARIGGYEEIALLIEQEQEKRIKQPRLSIHNSFHFFVEHHDSTRKQTCQKNEERDKQYKLEHDANTHENPSL